MPLVCGLYWKRATTQGAISAVVLGIGSMGDLKKVGRIGGKALLYFEIVTTLALFIGVAVAAVVPASRADIRCRCGGAGRGHRNRQRSR